MTTLSRRRFLGTSAMGVGATMATSLLSPARAGTVKELVPRKFPFPPPMINMATMNRQLPRTGTPYILPVLRPPGTNGCTATAAIYS